MSLSLFAYRAASEFLEVCPSEMIINAVVSVYWATHLLLIFCNFMQFRTISKIAYFFFINFDDKNLKKMQEIDEN